MAHSLAQAYRDGNPASMVSNADDGEIDMIERVTQTKLVTDSNDLKIGCRGDNEK
jgi:hypothetical protein